MINKRYADYKNISSYHYVDEIPTDWELLPNIALFNERIEKNNIDEELLSVTIKKGIIKQKDVKIKKDSSNEDKSNYKLVKSGDIAYNKMRMWQGAVGYSKFRGIVSPAYIVLKPKAKINSVFFHYLLRTDYFNNYARRFSYGLCDDQLNLRYKDFKRMYSIVPPLSTQTKIAEYLDRKQKQAINFIAKRQKMIELLKEQKKAIINKAVTKGINPNVKMKDSGVEWLGEIPEHWEVRKLKEFANFVNRGTTPNYVEKSDYKVVNQATFSKGFFDESNIRFHNTNKIEQEKGKLLPNDILMASTGGGVLGKVGMFNEELGIYIADSHVTIIRDSKIRFIPKYLYYFYHINHNLLDGYFGQGSTNQTELQREWLRQMHLAFPNLNEQTQIVKYIDEKTSKIDSAISKAEEDIKLIKEYLESLIFNVVTGQKKV